MQIVFNVILTPGFTDARRLGAQGVLAGARPCRSLSDSKTALALSKGCVAAGAAAAFGPAPCRFQVSSFVPRAGRVPAHSGRRSGATRRGASGRPGGPVRALNRIGEPEKKALAGPCRVAPGPSTEGAPAPAAFLPAINVSGLPETAGNVPGPSTEGAPGAFGPAHGLQVGAFKLQVPGPGRARHPGGWRRARQAKPVYH
jgi:hypothetical protein